MPVLSLNRTTSLGDLKASFSKIYGHLKIEIENPAQCASLSDDVSLGELTKVDALKMVILDDYYVMAVKQLFLEKLGLAILLFRKNGQGWIPVNSYDNVTLKELMERSDFHNLQHR